MYIGEVMVCEGTISEVASVSEFEKDLRKKKEGTDTLNQNQENSTKPAELS